MYSIQNRVVTGFTIALLAAVAVSAAAQSRSDRTALASFRDSLTRFHDTVALVALEARDIDSARAHRDDGLLHLRLGLIALRLGDMTRDGDHYSAAGGEFEYAGDLHSDWPYPRFGLGLAEVGEGRMLSGNIAARVFGVRPFDQAAADLAQSARIDPTFSQALTEPVMTSLARGDEALQTVALLATRKAAALPVAKRPDVRLARALIEREIGDPDSALAALDALLKVEPRNSEALLEDARTLLELGRLDGAAPWYRGLALADSATLARYRNDLVILLPDSTLHAFDTAPSGTARADLMRKFWQARDELNSSAERLREHYRRLNTARRNFAVMEHGDRDDLPALLDDRGLIFVRHGPPDERDSLTIGGIPSNETWRYARPHGDLVLHFVETPGRPGMHLVSSILDILALSNQAKIGNLTDSTGKAVVTYGAGLIAQTAQELLRSRIDVAPIYGQMLSAGPRNALALQSRERATGERNTAIALTTDSWKLAYELPLQADVQLVAVGADSSGPALQVAFAIPGGAIVPERTDRGFLYVVRTRVAVVDPSGAVVASVDTTRGFITPAWLAPDGLLLGRLPVPVPAGTYSVRVALESEAAGLVTPRQTVHVTSLAGQKLALSDLALGKRSVPLSWPTFSRDTAWIDPTNSFTRAEPMELYFDVGGLAAGTPYRTELTVVRTSAGAAAREVDQGTLSGDAMLKLGFDERFPGGVAPAHREVSLAKLRPGEYIMEVVISTANGARAVRRREFTIVK